MASVKILLVSILLIAVVQGQYANNYQRAFGVADADEELSDDDKSDYFPSNSQSGLNILSKIHNFF